MSTTSMPSTTCPNGAKCMAGIEKRVVDHIDEHLRRPRVRSRVRERDVAALVALLHRIVLEVLRGRAPHLLHRRRPAHAELRHEPGQHTEETHVVVEAVFDEVVEPIGAKRRPLAVYFDDEHALARVELRLVGLGRFGGERGRGQQLVRRGGLRSGGLCAHERDGSKDKRGTEDETTHAISFTKISTSSPTECTTYLPRQAPTS